MQLLLVAIDSQYRRMPRGNLTPAQVAGGLAINLCVTLVTFVSKTCAYKQLRSSAIICKLLESSHMTGGNSWVFPDREDLRPQDDDFLIREGFDLLAAYRSVKNDDVRKSILDMVVKIAQAQDDRQTTL